MLRNSGFAVQALMACDLLAYTGTMRNASTCNLYIETYAVEKLFKRDPSLKLFFLFVKTPEEFFF